MFADFKKGTAGPLGAMRVVEDPLVVERVEDWSRCRSPSRARRRHTRGIATRLRVIDKPACFAAGDTLYMHPDLARQVRERLAKDVQASIDARMLDAINGKG